MVVQKESDDLSDGSTRGTTRVSPPLSTDCQLLQKEMSALTAAMTEQNRALWALVHQTAALLEMVIESEGEEEEEGAARYLDGTPIAN